MEGLPRVFESYTPGAVARRGFAFDGVVVAVGTSVSDRSDDADLGLPGVTFEVREWFSGGRGGSVYDPTDAVGRLMVNVLAMVAEFESDHQAVHP